MGLVHARLWTFAPARRKSPTAARAMSQARSRCLPSALRCPGGAAHEARIFADHWPSAVSVTQCHRLLAPLGRADRRERRPVTIQFLSCEKIGAGDGIRT